MSHQFWIGLEATASYMYGDALKFGLERHAVRFVETDAEWRWRKKFWAGWVRDRQLYLLVMERGGMFPPRGGGNHAA
jgi:hypothetical protein